MKLAFDDSDRAAAWAWGRALPLRMSSFLSVTFALLVMTNIRCKSFPLNEIPPASAEASMVSWMPVIESSPLVSVMVAPFRVGSKSMVSPLVAVAMASRSEPGSESLVL